MERFLMTRRMTCGCGRPGCDATVIDTLCADDMPRGSALGDVRSLAALAAETGTPVTGVRLVRRYVYPDGNTRRETLRVTCPDLLSRIVDDMTVAAG